MHCGRVAFPSTPRDDDAKGVGVGSSTHRLAHLTLWAGGTWRGWRLRRPDEAHSIGRASRGPASTSPIRPAIEPSSRRSKLSIILELETLSPRHIKGRLADEATAPLGAVRTGVEWTLLRIREP